MEIEGHCTFFAEDVTRVTFVLDKDSEDFCCRELEERTATGSDDEYWVAG
jgi:hypothetical protein